MAELTNMERVAQELGCPSTLFGLTPNEFDYWLEPGLPAISPLLNAAYHGLDPVACTNELAGLWLFDFEQNDMAPRFRRGMVAGGKVMAQGSPLPVGAVVACGHHAASGCWVARVAEVGPDWLRLSYDNRPETFCISWVPDATAPAFYRITHYARCLTPGAV